MTPEERKYLDQHEPDHHISLDYYGCSYRVKCYGEFVFFSSRFCGGKDGAYKAAKQFRDMLPDDAFSSSWDTSRFKPQGASGIQGVSKKNSRGEFVGWVAHWRVGDRGNRKTKTKSFSFAKYGARALELAAEEREKQEKLNRIR